MLVLLLSRQIIFLWPSTQKGWILCTTNGHTGHWFWSYSTNWQHRQRTIDDREAFGTSQPRPRSMDRVRRMWKPKFENLCKLVAQSRFYLWLSVMLNIKTRQGPLYPAETTHGQASPERFEKLAPFWDTYITFQDLCVARELNMQRDDVEELAMRVLENLDQYEQSNRRYVLAAEAPKPILKHTLLQNYQLAGWAYTEKVTTSIWHQLRSLPVKWRQWYVEDSFDWTPPLLGTIHGNWVRKYDGRKALPPFESEDTGRHRARSSSRRYQSSAFFMAHFFYYTVRTGFLVRFTSYKTSPT